MPKGANKKPDILLSGQTLKNVSREVATSDDLSTVDKGCDFVKAGETAQVSNRQ